MQTPERLLELLDDGIIEEVIRPLKSGKEASVFIVRTAEGFCAAKVYKEAHARTFRHRGDYTEGRKVGDTRTQRAMDRGSRFGKEQREAAWQNSEADAMQRLAAAGVRIPRPIMNAGGVLLMELVVDRDGDPAPQLASQRYTRESALRTHLIVVGQIVRMLCAGIVHGDLSEFNILAAADGPVIIDLPQAIDAAKNTQAKRLLMRDVNRIRDFFGRAAPELRRTDFAQEMWLLYDHASLRPDQQLTGRFSEARKVVDTDSILREIEAAKEEAAKREEVRLRREAERRSKGQGQGPPPRR